MSDLFYLFVGNRYYPLGGAEDFAGVFDNLEVAVANGKTKAASESRTFGWWQVADDSMNVVAEGEAP